MAPVDLLNWPEVRARELAAEAAEEAWRIAQRRFHIAPHGEREKRRSVLKTAAEAVLRAEIELARVRDEDHL
jgi:hypothetical protein